MKKTLMMICFVLFAGILSARGHVGHVSLGHVSFHMASAHVSVHSAKSASIKPKVMKTIKAHTTKAKGHLTVAKNKK